MTKTLVTEGSIADLPPPVQRCLRLSGAVGTPVPKSVVARLDGRLRSSPTGRWLRFKSLETYEVSRPGFIWDAAVKVGPVTVGRAVDSLVSRRGSMQVTLLGFLKLIDVTGPEMDQGALLRWLNETMWFPAVWATRVISWEAIDDSSAIGSVTAGQVRVSGEFRFDREGRFVDFNADRHRSVGKEFVLTPWSTPVHNHAQLAGVVVPTAGSGVWHPEDGEAFEYIQLEVKALDYHD